MSLNSEEMSVVLKCALDAVQQVLDNSVGETRAKYMQLVYEFTVRRRAPMIFTESGLSSVVQLCFGEEAHQIFTERLQSIFFTYWGSVDRYPDLCEVLSWAAGRADVTRGVNNSVVPNQIIERTANRDEAKRMLMDNSWLVPYLLLPMVVHIDLDSDGNAKGVKQKGV